MLEKKKSLEQEELQSVNGGAGGNGEFMFCKECNKEFNIGTVDSRKIGSGCDYYYEYKCPYCGHWGSI